MSYKIDNNVRCISQNDDEAEMEPRGKGRPETRVEVGIATKKGLSIWALDAPICPVHRRRSPGVGPAST
jgi:hypothetical protein